LITKTTGIGLREGSTGASIEILPSTSPSSVFVAGVDEGVRRGRKPCSKIVFFFIIIIIFFDFIVLNQGLIGDFRWPSIINNTKMFSQYPTCLLQY